METTKEKISAKLGSATSKVCPKAGFIKLWTSTGSSIVMPTNCKTWRCLSCRERLKAVVRGRIVAGLSHGVEGSYFITLTYKTESNIARKDVLSVRRDWTAWLRIVRQRYPLIAWFRVVEATKKGQPHLHVLMTGVGNRNSSCLGRSHGWGKRWKEMQCITQCLEHELGRLWQTLTEDSWIVSVSTVLGAKGAASYLTKYLVKSMMTWSTLHQLGFRRRWSCSRNWKGGDRLRLLGTIEGRWYHSEFIYQGGALSSRFAKEMEWGENSPLAERTGSPLAWKEDRDRVRSKALTQIRRIRSANIRPKNVIDNGTPGR